MGVRLYPAREGDYDYDELRERLREAKVNPGIKISASRVDETAHVAERLGVDPTPLREALGVSEEKTEPIRRIPRRTLSEADARRLCNFCTELLDALDSTINFEEIREVAASLDSGETLEDYVGSEADEHYRTARYARTIEALCEKSIEWDFQLSVR